jgi:hypothetical protein
LNVDLQLRDNDKHEHCISVNATDVSEIPSLSSSKIRTKTQNKTKVASAELSHFYRQPRWFRVEHSKLLEIF